MMSDETGQNCLAKKKEKIKTMQDYICICTSWNTNLTLTLSLSTYDIACNIHMIIHGNAMKKKLIWKYS